MVTFRFRIETCFGIICGIVLALLLLPSATAQTYNVLYNFTGAPDGQGPFALMLDAAGNIYGTTRAGGSVNNGSYCYDAPGCGTLFKIDASGNESVVYAFAPVGIEKGYTPSGTTLVRDGAGNIFGTTRSGGNFGCGGLGCGTVYKVSPSGKETVIHRFTGINGDGALPVGLSRDAAGNLYGTTAEGGLHNNGTVFKIDPAGNEVVLHTFQGSPSDGSEPIEGVVLDEKGNIYGTTFLGGTLMGTIFEVSNTGAEKVLYNFISVASGIEAEGTLLRDAAGNLYGTTAIGGDSSCSCGVIYKLGPAGNYSVLYEFTGAADGAFPQTGLGRDAAGNLYGMNTSGGGTGACGTAFKLSPAGKLSVLHAFKDCGENGVAPNMAPVVDAAGNVYWTTGAGGPVTSQCPHGCGIAFKITP